MGEVPGWAPLFGFLGVAVTALGAYYVAKRKTSGTVATTPAEKLWEVLNARLDSNDKEITRLHGELDKKDERINYLETELSKERAHSRGLSDHVRANSVEIERLRRELEHVGRLHAQVEQLEKKMNGGKGGDIHIE